MAYGQKVINIIGQESWDDYQDRAEAYFNELDIQGAEPFDWELAAQDGPSAPDKPNCRWERADEPQSLTHIRITTEWMDETFTDTIVRQEPLELEQPSEFPSVKITG